MIPNAVTLRALLLFSPVLFALTVRAIEHEDYTEVKNKDGSRVRLLRDDTGGPFVGVSVLLLKPKKEEWRKVLDMKLTRVEGPAFGAEFSDIDEDGFADLILRGECGAGPNCETTIYRFDAGQGDFYHFMSAGGVPKKVSGDYLVQDGRSSCCSWSYNVYALSKARGAVNDNWLFGIEVEALESKESGEVTKSSCAFVNEKGFIAPPAKRWLKYCAHYGSNYVVENPKTKKVERPLAPLAVDAPSPSSWRNLEESLKTK